MFFRIISKIKNVPISECGTLWVDFGWLFIYAGIGRDWRLFLGSSCRAFFSGGDSLRSCILKEVGTNDRSGLSVNTGNEGVAEPDDAGVYFRVPMKRNTNHRLSCDELFISGLNMDKLVQNLHLPTVHKSRKLFLMAGY